MNNNGEVSADTFKFIGLDWVLEEQDKNIFKHLFQNINFWRFINKTRLCKP